MKVVLRDYQKRALEIALQRKRIVIVMPTGSGKTIVAGSWLRELKRRGLKRAVVIEPTRILVEQNSRLLNKIFELYAKPLHGGKSEKEKSEALKAEVVVATPEELLNFMDLVESAEAVVVDECHHTTGKDAYVKVMKNVRAEWRLGLSAFIPSDRRILVERYIGEIFVWSYEDPDITKYLPNWIGEVYEAPLCKECLEYYKKLQSMWASSAGRLRALYALAMRFLARDGALALKESASKGTLLSHLLSEVDGLNECIESCPLHKLPHLMRTLNDHEFEKALVFVDRVVVAKEVAKKLDAALILGKRGGGAQLEEARRAKVIVSTSAGEEGLDLPEVDVLIIWSNTSSSLRLIQRIGRLLRPKKDATKFLVFIATPETVDMDLLVEGLEAARKAGVDTHVDPNILKEMLKKTTVGNIMEILRGRPLYEEFIAELASVPLSNVRKMLRRLSRIGEVAYIYGPAGKLWFRQEDALLVWSELEDYLQPCINAIVRVKEVGTRGTPSKVVEKLMKLNDIGPLTVEVRYRTKSMEVYDIRRYNFVIKNPEVIKLVIYNASSRGLLNC